MGSPNLFSISQLGGRVVWNLCVKVCKFWNGGVMIEVYGGVWLKYVEGGDVGISLTKFGRRWRSSYGGVGG